MFTILTKPSKPGQSNFFNRLNRISGFLRKGQVVGALNSCGAILTAAWHSAAQ